MSAATPELSSVYFTFENVHFSAKSSELCSHFTNEIQAKMFYFVCLLFFFFPAALRAY